MKNWHEMTGTDVVSKRKLILVELNEINFDIARDYTASRSLPAFERLLSGKAIRTSAEQRYESLEPWIQWPSAHSGLTAEEHSVFRLGDIVHTKFPQIFEQLEGMGLRVGAVSPMNAENRLRDPAYFIPDPWTRTAPDKSWWSRVLTAAVSQAVNDNSEGTITATSALHLALGLVRFSQPKHYATYLRLALRCRGASWRKALLLDLLLHDVHAHWFKSKRPHFSTLFLNAGAHIQHHYFFNSRVIRDRVSLRNPEWYVSREVDPIGEMLEVYDRILGDYLAMPDVELIVATGLSQRPYDRVKFYYRFKDHRAMLGLLGIRYRDVLPRMTRDFLAEFDSAEEAAAAERRLRAIRVDAETPLFGEIDNRGSSLFVTLTYPHEITDSTTFEVDGKRVPLLPLVAFVAIKNGMHQETGFAFFSREVKNYAPRDGDHVKELYGTIRQYFGASRA